MHSRCTKGRIDAFANCATISKISKDTLSSKTIASIQIWKNIPQEAHSPDWRTARTNFIRHVLIDRTLVIHQTDGLKTVGPGEVAEARAWIFGSLAKYEYLTQACHYRSFAIQDGPFSHDQRTRHPRPSHFPPTRS